MMDEREMAALFAQLLHTMLNTSMLLSSKEMIDRV